MHLQASRATMAALETMAAALDEATPFVDLTRFVDAAALDTLDESLNAALDAFDGDFTVFHANLGQKHGDAIELCDAAPRPASAPADGDAAFRWCRAHRGDATTWRPNRNAERFRCVADFAASLPFFASTGKIAVVLNGTSPDAMGVEHCDHGFPDLVSEFVWIRPKSSRKRFYVRGAALAKREVPPGPRVLWFDDHLPHGIEGTAGRQVSIRVDGIFAPLYREYLARAGAFGDAAFDGGASLAEVLRAQGGGLLSR